MYAQTLLIVMLTLTLGMALLTNGLLSTRAAFNGLTSRYLDAAMTQSEAQATGSLRSLIQEAGSNGPWSTSTRSLPSGLLCNSSIPGTSCQLAYQANWQIVGSSSTSANPSLGADLARNLQIDVVNEQRVSARIDLTLSNATSRESLGTRTRFLTIRVFRLPPYAIISGVRDFETVNGRFEAVQGDNGGTTNSVPIAGVIPDLPAPDPSEPDRYRDTAIKVLVKCRNDVPVVDVMAANSSKQNDHLPWGAGGAGAYEAPCVPAEGFVTPPPGGAPVRMDYNDSGSQKSESWASGDNPKSEPP